MLSSFFFFLLFLLYTLFLAGLHLCLFDFVPVVVVVIVSCSPYHVSSLTHQNSPLINRKHF